MEMAFKGEIIDESERFKEHIFPRDLESKIEKKIKELNDQIIK